MDAGTEKILDRSLKPRPDWTTLTLTKDKVSQVSIPLFSSFSHTYMQCHLRVSTPAHVRLISQHFTQNPTVQDRGLDDSGTPISSMNSGMKAIIIEVVEGKGGGLWAEGAG